MMGRHIVYDEFRDCEQGVLARNGEKQILVADGYVVKRSRQRGQSARCFETESAMMTPRKEPAAVGPKIPFQRVCQCVISGSMDEVVTRFKPPDREQLMPTQDWVRSVVVAGRKVGIVHEEEYRRGA